MEIRKFFKPMSMKKAMKGIKSIKFYACNGKIKMDDLIILNANNFIPRKRFKETFMAFKMVKERFKISLNIRLWLHTNTKSPEFKIFTTKIEKYILSGDVIITHNNVTDNQLNIIYNLCDIGIQTSTGEAWSLTNCEHSAVNKIQVVPNFLATKYNFTDREPNILIPVSVVEDLDEGGNKIYRSSLKILDICACLQKAVCLATETRKETNQSIYTPPQLDYSWKSAAQKLKTFLV